MAFLVLSVFLPRHKVAEFFQVADYEFDPDLDVESRNPLYIFVLKGTLASWLYIAATLSRVSFLSSHDYNQQCSFALSEIYVHVLLILTSLVLPM